MLGGSGDGAGRNARGRRLGSRHTGVDAMADQKTVLTTGVNSGIGLATVLELARRGHRSVGSVRSAAKARLVHEAARAADVEVETVLLDVTDAAACRRVVTPAPPAAPVNNAASASTAAAPALA